MEFFRKLALIPLLLTLLISGITMVPHQSKAATIVKTNKTPHYSDKDLQEISKNLADQGVNNKTQQALIKKLKNGEQLDSQKPNAVPDKTDLKSFPNGSMSRKDTYKDGSVTIISIEVSDDSSPSNTETLTSMKTLGIKPISAIKPTSGIKTVSATIHPLSTSISGGTVNNGSGYHSVSKAKVSYSGANIKCFYYISYTFVNGGYDYISFLSPTYEAYVQVIGGTYANKAMHPTKLKENINGRAYGSLSFDATLTGTVTMLSCLLKVYVGNNSISATAVM